MQNQLHELLRENKLDMLTDQNNELRKQLEVLRSTNAALVQSLAQVDQDEVFRLRLTNSELTDQLYSQRKRAEDLEARHYAEITQLNKELAQSRNDLEMMQVLSEKQLFKKDQDITQLRSQVRDRNDRLSDCQGRLSDYQGRLSDYQGQLHDLTAQKNCTQNSLNTLNIPDRNTLMQQKARQYMRKDKGEIKIAMKALNQASRSLQAGVEASMLSDISHINRTSYK